MKILQMQGLQNNIERHNFHYIIPKVLSEKFSLKDDDSQSSKHQNRKGGKTKRDLKDIDSKL